MSVASSPSEAARPAPAPAAVASDARLARADGAVRLGFTHDGTASRLAELAQRSPCRAILPDDGHREPVAVLLNTAGGVCGGDVLATGVRVGRDAAATVAGQAAERIYRAIDRPAQLTTTLAVGDGGRLHWAPQETILFDGARLARCTTIELAPGARLLAAETLVFGRLAMGERLTALSLRDAWRVRCAQGPGWAETLRLDDPRPLSAPAGLDGQTALASLVAAGPELEAHRDRLRHHCAGAPLRAGASVVNGLLLVRLLGAPATVRATLTRLLEELRGALLELAPDLPRVWRC